MRSIRLIAVLALGLMILMPGAVLAQDQPNIMVIWGDDIGWFNISAYNDGMMIRS